MVSESASHNYSKKQKASEKGELQMTNFDLLFNEYANTKNGDVYAFCQKYHANSVATRFLLIRSFDSENLKNLLTRHNVSFSSGKEKELMQNNNYFINSAHLFTILDTL